MLRQAQYLIHPSCVLSLNLFEKYVTNQVSNLEENNFLKKFECTIKPLAPLNLDEIPVVQSNFNFQEMWFMIIQKNNIYC